MKSVGGLPGLGNKISLWRPYLRIDTIDLACFRPRLSSSANLRALFGILSNPIFSTTFVITGGITVTSERPQETVTSCALLGKWTLINFQKKIHELYARSLVGLPHLWIRLLQYCGRFPMDEYPPLCRIIRLSVLHTYFSRNDYTYRRQIWWKGFNWEPHPCSELHCALLNLRGEILIHGKEECIYF